MHREFPEIIHSSHRKGTIQLSCRRSPEPVGNGGPRLSLHETNPPASSTIESRYSTIHIAGLMTHHDLTLLPSPGNHGLFRGNHPQMAELFRLVNHSGSRIHGNPSGFWANYIIGIDPIGSCHGWLQRIGLLRLCTKKVANLGLFEHDKIIQNRQICGILLPPHYWIMTPHAFIYHTCIAWQPGKNGRYIHLASLHPVRWQKSNRNMIHLVVWQHLLGRVMWV